MSSGNPKPRKACTKIGCTNLSCFLPPGSMCYMPPSNESNGNSEKSDPLNSSSTTESESLSEADSADERSAVNPGKENVINAPTIRPNTIKTRKLGFKKGPAAAGAAKPPAGTAKPLSGAAKSSAATVSSVCSDPACSDPNCTDNAVCTDPGCTGCDSGHTNYVRMGLFGAFGAVFALIVGYALYLKFKTKPKTPKNVLPVSISTNNITNMVSQ